MVGVHPVTGVLPGQTKNQDRVTPQAPVVPVAERIQLEVPLSKIVRLNHVLLYLKKCYASIDHLTFTECKKKKRSKYAVRLCILMHQWQELIFYIF